ncbi:MAG: glycerol-3-phosphate acyltransferase [Armatimonadota bacterium]|nr:glycerol-3-phosphate acyltransferase [Armatimonadota bacterium]MDR7545607.1 glycerol-3-phosphate acyltransferase [Armatimonadota bacterium]
MKIPLVLVAAYLLGALPSALVVSRRVAGVDIRTVGDGNMGARNVARTLGWRPAAAVGAADFGKGALAIAIAQAAGLSLGWQLAAGAAAVLGHDFPVFAQFRGGQGMATILGTLAVLMPVETFLGLAIFAGGYLLLRHFDASATLGLGSLVLLAWLRHRPGLLIGYAVLAFLSIPAKKAWDLRRRRLREPSQVSVRGRDKR